MKNKVLAITLAGLMCMPHFAYAKTIKPTTKSLTVFVKETKTLKVKSKKKVKWKTSNKKIVSIKSLSKSSIKITGKKKGSATVTGTSGKQKWIFKVNVKSQVKVNSKFYFKADRVPSTIKIFWPGVATNPVNENQLSSSKVDPVDVEGSSHPEIGAIVDDNSKVNCVSSDPSILKVVRPDLSHYVKEGIFFNLIPYKTGTVTLTMTYPGGSYKKKVTVKPSAVYEKIKNFIPAVKNSGLDDAHKAFVIAAWQCKHMAYGYSKSGGLYGDIVEGKGVCDDYTAEYNFLLSLVGIKSRRVASLSMDHAWSQVLINNKWYNVDTTAADAYNLINNPSWYSGGSVFMKSDFTEEFSNYSGRGYDAKATATDYDNYDWEPFTKTDQFKQLINL